MKNQKGFTIVELVVVIAVIAILATIVLINIEQYIRKSRDSAIRADMHTLQVDGATNYGSYNNYYLGGNDFADTDGDGIEDEGETGAGVIFCEDNDAWDAILKLQPSAACNANAADGDVEAATSYCACVNLLSDTTKYFCVDSTGKAIETATNCTETGYCGGTSNTICPAS